MTKALSKTPAYEIRIVGTFERRGQGLYLSYQVNGGPLKDSVPMKRFLQDVGEGIRSGRPLRITQPEPR